MCSNTVDKLFDQSVGRKKSESRLAYVCVTTSEREKIKPAQQLYYYAMSVRTASTPRTAQHIDSAHKRSHPIDPVQAMNDS